MLRNLPADLGSLVQGLWKGVLPSLVMVSNPTINYVLYEWLLARLADLKRRRASATTGVH